MECPKCHAEVDRDAVFCSQCGVVQPRRRFVFEPPREEFTLKSEEPFELGDEEERARWQVPSEVPATEWQPAQRPIILPPPEEPSQPPAIESLQENVWGGFFRRGAALLIDCLIIVLLSLLMALLSYVGYKVGLTAHQRTYTWSNVRPLATILIIASTMLSMGYFVLFHGMEGKTVGKWLLRLRVVGPKSAGISYPRACLRWFGTVVFAPLLLGFLWVLWSREKRAWHDYLAGTWVIRE